MAERRKRSRKDPDTYVHALGQSYTDPVELSAAVLSNYAEMEDEILSPDSELKDFLRAKGLDEAVDLIDAYIANGCLFEDDGSGAIDRVRAFMAAYYLAVMLDPGLEFPVFTEEGWDFVETVDELLDRLSTGKYDNPEPLGIVNQIVLTSPALTVWLSNVNMELAEKSGTCMSAGRTSWTRLTTIPLRPTASHTSLVRTPTCSSARTKIRPSAASPSLRSASS